MVIFLHLDDAIPGGTLFIGLQGDDTFHVLRTPRYIVNGDLTNLVQARDAIRAGKFGWLCRGAQQAVAAKADYYVIIMIDETIITGQWYAQGILYRK